MISSSETNYAETRRKVSVGEYVSAATAAQRRQRVPAVQKAEESIASWRDALQMAPAVSRFAPRRASTAERLRELKKKKCEKQSAALRGSPPSTTASRQATRSLPNESGKERENKKSEKQSGAAASGRGLVGIPAVYLWLCFLPPTAPTPPSVSLSSSANP